MTSTALAIRDEQTYWDDSQIAVLRANGINEDVTRAELQAYLHECQIRKLDPFAKQIYLIGRWDKQAGRKVYRSQTSIDGFRLIARRAADKAGESIEYEDTLWCAEDGQWTDVWLSREPPAACKVTVLRNGKRFPVTARYDAYVQTNQQGDALGLWRKMPDGQIAKCCEALALRKAFPEELGGIYTEEEMAQADNPSRTTATVTPLRGAGEQAVQPQPAAIAGVVVFSAEDVQALLTRASSYATKIEGDAIWKEVLALHQSGAITGADAKAAKDAIGTRFREITAPAPALGAEDPWAGAVAGIQSGEDVARVLSDLADATGLDDAHRERIIAAVEERAAAMSGEAAA